MRPASLKTLFSGVALAFTIIAGACYAGEARTVVAAAPTTANTLEAVNTTYRALYRKRTQQVLESLPLVLVVQNNMVTAVRGHHRKLYAVPIQRYNEARAVVHAALGFHGLLSLQTQDAQPATQTLYALHAFQNDLDRTAQALRLSTLTRNEKALAQEILTTLGAATKEAQNTGRLTKEDIAGTLRTVEPKLTALAASIGEAHAQALQTALRRAQADATEEEWNHAIAVVTGPATPRRNNLETAATASVIGAEYLGTRVFYSESIFDVDGALSYLQTLMGDRELSLHVFGQPHRMWEDLFAPVSRELVDGDFYTALPN